MTLDITLSGQACGAFVRGVDLTKPLVPAQVAEIRAAWLEHHVLAFPDQPMSDDNLEAFTIAFGGFGDDPFIAPIAGREHVIAVCRAADETAPLFAETWHTDWSFQTHPPAGTCLFGIDIPPVGGDTMFADQHKALAAMPEDLRTRIEGKQAIHSAIYAYAPEGSYGDDDQKTDRSMDIRPSTQAREQGVHALIRAHPETGALGIFGTIGYIIGIENMPQTEAWALLGELQEWQGREEFCYRHKWQKDMLVMWDNRSVLHRATGGYEGHARMLHRTTIAAYS
ncbi:MAG: TauD/TfdA family dioxygenase [Alphaproteobacteria bacterium]|nr:TauD/TfdA family dioxygenase [Alphaproteobacteria bacterium]